MHHNDESSFFVCKTQYDELDNMQSVNEINEIETTVVLATACVRLQAGVHLTEPCRAMLDTGAEGCVISRDCVKRLRIPATRCRGRVIGVTGAEEQITEKLNYQHWCPMALRWLTLASAYQRKCTCC